MSEVSRKMQTWNVGGLAMLHASKTKSDSSREKIIGWGENHRCVGTTFLKELQQQCG